MAGSHDFKETRPWLPLTFGNHVGVTLPQLVFRDADYFFWLIDQPGFLDDRSFGQQAKELQWKATHIKIPQIGTELLVAEYHFSRNGFITLELVPASCAWGGLNSICLRVIDLSIPHRHKTYDKTGSRRLIRTLKSLVFGSESHHVTRRRAEFFFDDAANFDDGSGACITV